MNFRTKAILNFSKSMKSWPADARKKAAKIVKEDMVGVRAHYLLSGGVHELIMKETEKK